VQLKEVSQLSCSVSLLRHFEQSTNWQDWEIGQHGLIIEFVDPVLSCKRTATFLPEVAGDQGWSKQQCIEALVRKAGEPKSESKTLSSCNAALSEQLSAGKVWVAMPKDGDRSSGSVRSSSWQCCCMVLLAIHRSLLLYTASTHYVDHHVAAASS
jgi:hypothetical protein